MKDGLTYGVVSVTYNRYLELLPDLNDEQKREILANLVEAREHAMDAGRPKKSTRSSANTRDESTTTFRRQASI